MRQAFCPLCMYRAANSFNAFIPGRAVLSDKTFMTSDHADHFVPAWNKHCGGKSSQLVNVH
jgi:hypothetical protein